MGSLFFFFFFFSHPCSLFSVRGRGLWGWAGRRSGSGLLISLLLRGPGWSSCPHAGAKGFSSGIGRWLPLWGWLVPGPRSIECIWGVWVWVPCPFLCVYMWGEGVNIRLRAWGWGHMLVYMCACRLRLCVRSGLRLRLTHHLSRPPPHHHALPVEDAAGALVISRAGAGCSGERRPTLGGRLAGPGPTGLAGPRLWGGGPLGLRAQGPVRPGMVGCGGACGLAATAPWGAYTVAVGGPPSGSPPPFSGWRPRLSLRWFSWGSRALGVSGCLGPGSFPCLLHALRDGAVVPHTHY